MGLFSSRIASIFRALDFGRKTADPTLIVVLLARVIASSGASRRLC